MTARFFDCTARFLTARVLTSSRHDVGNIGNVKIFQQSIDNQVLILPTHMYTFFDEKHFRQENAKLARKSFQETEREQKINQGRYKSG
jgi:hypothetical protein